MNNNCLTKARLVDIIAELLSITKREAMNCIDTLIKTMKNTLESGESLKITGFGKFEVRQKRDRRGRNPWNGEELTVSTRKVVTFKPSPLLKGAINATTD